MPMDLSIIAAPRSGRNSSWMMDPVEWLAHPPPIPDAAERQVFQTPGYRDFILAVTAEELLEWHRRDRHRAFAPVYSGKAWRSRLDPKLARLEALLASRSRPDFFVAHWYEWESGMG